MSSLRPYALLVCCFGMVDAGLQIGSVTASKDNAAISPTLPTSDKKFFDKDYPGDKRPKVDVFHFHHPYPAVQDSDDFDKDFVKDENSDNGYFQAQTEYDRLRHKLQKEKAEVAKALTAKKKAESELKDATEREKEQEEKQRQLEKEEEEQKKEKQKAKESGGMSSSAGESKEIAIEERKSKVVPDKRTPGGAASPGQVKDQSKRVETQMKELEDCKKQLAEAREKLKKMMKELEEARKEQEKTQDALDGSLKRMETSERKYNVAETRAKKEYKEYMDAKDAYLKQQTKVAKMEMDIKIAAEKVKKLRDAEDKDGGVYPTNDNHSGTASRSLLLAAASVIAWAL